MYSSVTHIYSENDLRLIAEQLENTAAPSRSPHWTPGWPEEIEAALLDAVFPARALYGQPENGVRRVVSRWREHRESDQLDDLQTLASYAMRSEPLAEILGNRQRVAGNSTTKTECVASLAAVLHQLGVREAKDLIDSDAVGRTLDSQTARALLEITAEGIGVDHAALEHAVWRYQRRIPPRRGELPPSLSLSESG